jgi:hypothetical protein
MEDQSVAGRTVVSQQRAKAENLGLWDRIPVLRSTDERTWSY